MTILYKTNKNGSIQQWSIEVRGDSFICTYGQLNGKMTSQTTKCLAKNVGRANATTPEQQAELEAAALVTKKIKSGYSYDKTAPQTVSLPMKVKTYQTQIKNVKFPCFSSAKLDGVNAIYKRTNQVLTIYSRGGEVYPPIPHLEDEVHLAMDMLGSNELNGELYIHGEHLQDIQSAVKKPKELSLSLTFAIFDIADSPLPYSDRRAAMLTWTNRNFTAQGNVAVVVGKPVTSHEDIEAHYLECISKGFEGTVIKNHSALYQHNVRSSDMFKYKKAQSKEFLINSYNLDKNGLPVFVLQSDGGEFKAKPKGTQEFWSKQIPATYIGQYATCEYETYSKSGVPLKPVFISLRAMDSNGNPKE